MSLITRARRSHQIAKGKLHPHRLELPPLPDCLKILAGVIVICIALAVFALGYWVITMFGADVVTNVVRGLR